jgi:hypothetical protein
MKVDAGFREKIMLRHNLERDADSTENHRALMPSRTGASLRVPPLRDRIAGHTAP